MELLTGTEGGQGTADCDRTFFLWEKIKLRPYTMNEIHKCITVYLQYSIHFIIAPI